MKKSRYKLVWIILAIVLIVSMGKEFGAMAQQTSLADALVGMLIFTLLVIGVVFWIRKSRSGRNRIKRL